MNPDKHTLAEYFVDVGHGHQLYVQDWGKKTARVPIIFLHGGPGSSVQDKYKRLFHPTTQRVIFFDQRGCGKSLPYGSLEHNTTDDLVKDIETIADKLGIRTFIINGGSWGSTLALVFAIRHPKRVHALVMSGILTGTSSEINWLDKGKFAPFFPDVWQQYLDATPKSAHHDPSSYHFQRVLGNDPVAIKQSAYAYDCLEGGVIQLDDRVSLDDFETYDPAGMRLEIHYLSNKLFLPDNYVFKNATKLTMPVYMVQGRYDMVCPPITAYNLYNKLPKGHLIWTIGGHKDEHESWNIQRTILSELTR